MAWIDWNVSNTVLFLNLCSIHFQRRKNWMEFQTAKTNCNLENMSINWNWNKQEIRRIYLLRDQTLSQNRGKQKRISPNVREKIEKWVKICDLGPWTNWPPSELSLWRFFARESKFPIIFNLLKRTTYLHNIINDGRDRKSRQLFFRSIL